MNFWKEHFADILLAVLIIIFGGAAICCEYLKMNDLAKLFGGVAAGNFAGALVMRLRTSTDPAVMALLKNGSPPTPPVAPVQNSPEVKP